MSRAYGTICDRCGLDYRPVEADAGQIGGKVTTEFMALAPAGEAELVHCTCGYAANTEAGECLARPTEYEATELKKIAHPRRPHHRGARGVPWHPRKLHGEGALRQGRRGQARRDVRPRRPRAQRDQGRARRSGGFALLTDEEMESFGLHKGSMGPVGLPEGSRIIAARSLKGMQPLGRRRERGRLPLRGRRRWAAISRWTNGPTCAS